MGIVSFSHCFSRTPMQSVVLAPLQALMGWFAPAAPASGNAPATAIKRGLPRKLAMGVSPHAGQTRKQDAFSGTRIKPPLRPSPGRLKIVRKFEPGVSASCAGRMVISGRMADVCAELDRMAQREAVMCRP